MEKEFDVQQKVKDIKQSFRQLMDGAVAQSMRHKGLDYRLNWGITLPRLREMSEEILSSLPDNSSQPSPQYTLAVALWKENVRECKLLATMLIPPDQMLPELADLWMEQTESVEVAEQAAMNVYQYLPCAAEKAYQWIASEHHLYQLCGFHVLSRLFMNGREPDERGINEFLDQALAAIQGGNLVVGKAAMNSIARFSQLALVYKRLADSALRSIGLPPTL